jgi:hypothetical protein
MSKGTYADRVRIDIEETEQFETDPRDCVEIEWFEDSDEYYEEIIYSHMSCDDMRYVTTNRARYLGREIGLSQCF